MTGIAHAVCIIKRHFGKRFFSSGIVYKNELPRLRIDRRGGKAQNLFELCNILIANAFGTVMLSSIAVFANSKKFIVIAFLIFGKDKNFFFILTLYFGYTNDIDRAKNKRRINV